MTVKPDAGAIAAVSSCRNSTAFPNENLANSFYSFLFDSTENVSISSNTSHTTDATIKIYTLSGKLVKVIKNAVSGQAWDGCDQVGNHLSPDIYLFQISLYCADLKKNVQSRVGKIVINPSR
ncbi:MAG: hypothetical protein GX640_18150 [Fibrobacter sp.]|nr:hypothetical protein [Fibrobacter sp.]